MHSSEIRCLRSTQVPAKYFKTCWYIWFILILIKTGAVFFNSQLWSTQWVFLCIKYSKFWSVSLEPLIHKLWVENAITPKSLLDNSKYVLKSVLEHGHALVVLTFCSGKKIFNIFLPLSSSVTSYCAFKLFEWMLLFYHSYMRNGLERNIPKLNSDSNLENWISNEIYKVIISIFRNGKWCVWNIWGS